MLTDVHVELRHSREWELHPDVAGQGYGEHTSVKTFKRRHLAMGPQVRCVHPHPQTSFQRAAVLELTTW
jgi:hypothetical protein